MTIIQPEETLENLYQVGVGSSHPLGAIPDEHGVNFSVFADRATAVELLLFNEHDDANPMQIIRFKPEENKTFSFWHVYVYSLRAGAHYAYRIAGPNDLHQMGDRYNHNKVLIDPYARGNTDKFWDRAAACTPDDNVASAMHSVVIDTNGYDWEGDKPINRRMNETIIYEMHVRGFTLSPSSHCQHAGTFSAIIEKISYLKELGITAVELMPIFDFDEKEIKQHSPEGAPLPNYWGYDPVGFFAPQTSYCVSPQIGSHLNEFRDLVKMLHKADIEVILDVVFNHTSEGNEEGPTINFRGLANNVYYILSAQDRAQYMDYTGCGNTFNANHPITQKMIIDALEYWVTETHVDGFRFDEATILCRDEQGNPMTYPPVIWQIELSDVLADTKVIAEAWDAAGMYKVGYFPGYRWGEWNGRYRDAIRHFVKGDQGYIEGKTIVGRVADVISGSADIFQANGELPINSVNFITAHDGFTLNDLVSYNEKHNIENGENNRDGVDDNLSWNCGVEGASDDARTEELRRRQIKNFAAILMLSQGVPMFVAGDEVRRTQQGNNNAYCQDNEVSWFDWSLTQKNQDMLRFFKHMIAFRKSHVSLQRKSFFTGAADAQGLEDISWHGCRLYQPGWNNPNSRVLAFTLGAIEDANDIHVICNMDEQDLDFDMPPLRSKKWYCVVDTGQAAPHDIAEDMADPGESALVQNAAYHALSHSVVVCISR